ncbi:beta strand repeat-containing protein [Dongia sp.]|uniref:beta strand repeat-containing protein n=1 Tax=Dongia sp. TaxID=1977262 RepID=UPI003750D10F
MANDTSTPSGALDSHSDTRTDDFFTADQQDSVFVQVAQADAAAQPAAPAAAPGAPQQIAIPAGENVVRVPVQPGDVLVLSPPFTGEAEVIGRIGDGNLAIRVGDVTVILQGYVDANQQAPITVETSDGQPIDVATMLASTDPTIDIQTAAGPSDAAAGPQGADNNGALFSQFGPGGGLGGFSGVGAQDATELSYGLIDNSIRNDFAEPLLVGTTFGFAVGPLSGGHSERFFRDPAQTSYLGSFNTFMEEYQDAVENPENPLFPGWADFQGTGATNGDFQEYLDQTRRTVDVDATFTGGSGDLTLNGIAPGLTSNGSTLYVQYADGGHTMFVRRDSDDALVAVVHVEPTSTGFTIETIMINRLDHPDAGTGDAGRDEMTIGVEFTVYDGLLQEGEGNDVATPPSLSGSAEFNFADDVPLFDNVTYHNLDGAMVGDSLPTKDSTSSGQIDEDWLQGGANDKGADGKSNAGDNGDTAGGASVTGQVNITFGADGPAARDYKPEADKHAFVLDTSAYAEGEVFPYGDGTLKSGGQTLYVLSVGPDHLTVGIPGPDGEDSALSRVIGDTAIFTLVLDQDTGEFTFTLYGPLDHGTDLVFEDAAVLVGGNTEETIALAFGVTALDDDGDYVPATINIDVNDDLPVARDDSDDVAAGTYGPETGNVMANDSQGGDTAVVTAVAFEGKGGDLGSPLQGEYGKLTLNADGSYSYTRDPMTKGGVDDVFNYTITDKDGDTSTATLTIHIGNAGVDLDMPTYGGDGTVVYEKGLPERTGELAGSGEIADSNGTNDSDPSEHIDGSFKITAPDGIETVDIDGTVLTLADLLALGTTNVTISIPGTGDLTLNGFDEGTGVVSYTFTATDNQLSPTDVQIDFTVTVTDIDGSSNAGTLSFKLVDDEPTANPDSKTVSSGGQVSSNVETNDVFGADGKMGGTGVIGVNAGTNTAIPAVGAPGTPIVTSLGTLTLNADGSYTYVAKPNVSGVDHFVYTIQDGDTDVSTTTLDITVSAVRLETDVKTVTVNEAALDKTIEGNDIAAGSVIGSNPGSNDESKTGQLVLGSGVTAVAGDYPGTYGTLHVDSDGKFTYTLTSNLLVAGAGTNTKLDAEVFNITIQDAGGNTATDQIKINVIDDVPQAFNPQDQSLLNSPAGGVITGALDIAGHTGADGYGSIVFSGGTDNSKATLADGTTPITSGGKDVLLSGFGTDMLTGYVDANGNKSVDDGEAVFTVKLNGAADQYTFTLIKDIDDGARVDFTDLSGIKAGNTDWFGVGANGGAAGSKDLLYTPVDLSGDVNASKNDLGSNDQFIDNGEGLRMDFVNDLTGDMTTRNAFDFANHYQVQDYQVTIAQVQGGGTTKVRITAADVTNPTNVGAISEANFLAQTLVAITAGELVIMRGATDVTALLTIDYTNGGLNDGGVTIDGLMAGDIIKVHDSNGFDRIQIDGLGQDFAISGSQVLQTVAGTDLDMKFETKLTDGDGDTSTGQYIGINLQTDDGQSHTFNGGPGNDTMKGGSGSDLIFGDAGNDTMLYDSKDTFTGGAGFDRVLVEGGGNSITYDSAKFIGIEMIDLGDGSDRTGAQQNTLALSAVDVIAANGGATVGTVAGHQINFFVIGDTAGPTSADHDNVIMTGFGSKLGTGSFVDPVTGDSHTYDVYATVANPAVKVAIEQNLDVT